jgi:hypothetical protein
MMHHFVRRAGFELVALLALTGCGHDNPVAPEVEKNPDIRNYVVQEAAAALGSDGRFRIPPDINQTPESSQPLSAARASELAAAFVRSYGLAFLHFWEQDRGGSIELALLEVDPRVYPIQSPFGAVPPAGCHPAFTRLFGSYYQLTLDEGERSEVLMAVSAQLDDYGVDSQGNLTEPSLTGMDFLHEGIPLDGATFSPLSPEQAVAAAARATRARIRSVPVLVRRDPSYSPTVALWRLSLDREVNIALQDGSKGQTSVIYVSPSRDTRFFAAADSQPTSITANCLKVDENSEDAGIISVTVPINGDAKIDFVPISFVRA